LPRLVEWQRANRYPLRFACEATLNLAKNERVLELMREAAFDTVFCGIETPEEHALEFMHKEHNLRQPILDAVRTLNAYGLEVVSGIILGLDTDTPTTGRRIIDFIEASGIPMLTVNLLYALPKTPLWQRLETAGRLVEDDGRGSNVAFALPYETVVEMWRACIAHAYAPDALYRRFEHQMRHTYPNRKPLPATRARINAASLARGLTILARILWHLGVRSDSRRRFWQLAGPALRQGRIDEVIHVGLVAHHLIRFARECMNSQAEKSFYSPARKRASAHITQDLS
jgi:radical SAM superfamily enzyme YgiQ (UPF0313 family)